MPEPVSMVLLGALATKLGIEGIKGGVKGTIEGYKDASEESRLLFLQLVCFFGLLAPPISGFDPLDYLDEFRRSAKPNFALVADQEMFDSLIETRDPKTLMVIVGFAAAAATALYPIYIVGGAVKGACKKMVSFFVD